MKAPSNLTLTFILVSTLLAACDSEKNSRIDLGILLPLTGDNAQWGVPPRNGVELAVEEFNATSKDFSIGILEEDSRCTPDDGVSGLEKLASVHSIRFVVGAACSTVTLAIAPIAEKNKILLVSPASTHPDVTNAGDFIFRVVPSDALRGKVLAEYLYSDLGVRRVGLLYINNETGVGGRDAFANTFLSLGGSLVAEEAYQEGASEMRSQLSKLANKDLEGVVVISFLRDTVLVMRQRVELGITIPFFYQTEAVEDPNVLREAGKAAEGAIYVLATSSDNAATEDFRAAYKSEFNHSPELYAAEGYDIGRLLTKGIKTIGYDTVTSEALRDFLYSTQGYQGASGTISFDKHGDVVKPMDIKEIQNGEPTVIATKN
ncbi:MAG: penicillin-binding protein activator [Pseudomonadales bacterium]|nr:penicillin-binding protein activator [Pseudomonadales bacterium]